jgi:hypothetical protein
LRVFTTIGFPVLQFNAVKKQFVAARKVPQAVICEGEDRSFTGAVKKVPELTSLADD